MLHTFVKKKSGRTYRYYVPYLHKRRNAGASITARIAQLPHLPMDSRRAHRRCR